MEISVLEKKYPAEFVSRMKEMLGEEYPAYMESQLKDRHYGLRVNTAKISPEELLEAVPFSLRPVSWIPGGYFYDADSRPSKSPLYHAGLYYLQEPSAMTPASLLPVDPGDKVLDLCAAPGGKATALTAKLGGTGLLVANDISTSRARALLRNLELFGCANMIVSDEKPEKLADHFPGYFDKILLDAPCSGEGMFRKEEALLKDWSVEKSQALSRVQKQLIGLACDMLRPGGLLLYSTCTFAPCEDEEVIGHILTVREDMKLMPLPHPEGFAEGFPQYVDGREEIRQCVRLFPHKMEGEGHFMALLRKERFGGSKAAFESSSVDISESVAGSGKNSRHGKFGKGLVPDGNSSRGRSGRTAALDANSSRGKSGKAAALNGNSNRGRTGKGAALNGEALAQVHGFMDEIGLHSLGGQPFDDSRVLFHGEKAYLLPPDAPSFDGLSYLRYGLFLGESKKNRFEPSQSFALALRKGDVEACIDLSEDDPRLAAYLRGESVSVASTEAPHAKGWHLLTVCGYPLAWGKLVNGILKNKIPAGWRVTI